MSYRLLQSLKKLPNLIETKEIGLVFQSGQVKMTLFPGGNTNKDLINIYTSKKDKPVKWFDPRELKVAVVLKRLF